jgi:hypothetical protein
MTRAAQKTTRPKFILFLVCIRCRGNMFTEPLTSNDIGDTHTDTQTDGWALWSTPLKWTQMILYTYQVS